ncbi:MAG: galactose mutarotase [Clostridia bacterium]|nr:galactose mutarotase [Clostridia bacterium]
MGFSREYVLSSSGGMEITLLETGASLVGVKAADRHGVFANVALPLKGPSDISCAGATIAPYAGRIARGQLEISGEPYQLSLNEGRNHNHGGFHSLRDRPWRFESQREAAQYQEITFAGDLPDGTDGYPGNRRFTVTYRLWHDQQIEILLTAQTDRPTRVNMTNHAYFNLSGDFSQDISRHLLTLNAHEVYINDDEFLMIGRQPPPAPLDFRCEREIGVPCDHPQIARARGLNHCYILSKEENAPAATLVCPDSGRRMRLFTDQPCLMVYSGGYLDTPNSAITFEALEYPLSSCAEQPPVLYPGETYSRRIIYQFDIMP